MTPIRCSTPTPSHDGSTILAGHLDYSIDEMSATKEMDAESEDENEPLHMFFKTSKLNPVDVKGRIILNNKDHLHRKIMRRYQQNTATYWEASQTAIYAVMNYFQCPVESCSEVVTLILGQI